MARTSEIAGWYRSTLGHFSTYYVCLSSLQTWGPWGRWGWWVQYLPLTALMVGGTFLLLTECCDGQVSPRETLITDLETTYLSICLLTPRQLPRLCLSAKFSLSSSTLASSPSQTPPLLRPPICPARIHHSACITIPRRGG
ncbi:hypothetical protein F4680DRAFT_833 [Xylaria scruposa]|nr:hypothetical protein F4680DRAFT_833 [Xylaria scruposa]